MLLTSTVLACSLLWAIIASVMAYNHGREIHTMAGRHNSVVKELNLTAVRLSNTRHELTLAQDAAKTKAAEHRDKERDLEKVYLTALEISNERLEELEKLKGHIDALNVRHARMTTRHRDPKTGRIVKAPKPTAENSVGLAVFDEVRNLCDVVKANAVEDVNTESAMNMGRTMNIANSQVYRCNVTNIGFNHTKDHDVVEHDGAFEPCDLPDDIDPIDVVDHGVVSGQYMYTTKRPEQNSSSHT